MLKKKSKMDDIVNSKDTEREKVVGRAEGLAVGNLCLIGVYTPPFGHPSTIVEGNGASSNICVLISNCLIVSLPHCLISSLSHFLIVSLSYFQIITLAHYHIVTTCPDLFGITLPLRHK